MSYSAPNRIVPEYMSIDTLTEWGEQATVGYNDWPSANLAMYVPVRVHRHAVVKQLWWRDYVTGSGNYDIGLYDAAGTALLRKGSTAYAAGFAIQKWNCTDTPIQPGVYYLAMALSATISVQIHTATAPIAAAMGVLSEASAFPLPATATWSVTATSLFPALGMLLVA